MLVYNEGIKLIIIDELSIKIESTIMLNKTQKCCLSDINRQNRKLLEINIAIKVKNQPNGSYEKVIFKGLF